MELERSFIKNLIRLLLQVSCYVAFLIQVILLAAEEMKPSQTETRLKEMRIEEVEFPVVFKLCFMDKMDVNKVRDAGYKSMWRYFLGQSRFNDSIYGWAGHDEDGNMGKGIEGWFSN